MAKFAMIKTATKAHDHSLTRISFLTKLYIRILRMNFSDWVLLKFCYSKYLKFIKVITCLNFVGVLIKAKLANFYEGAKTD